MTQITNMFARTNNKTHHINLNHKYSKGHSTKKRNREHVLVTFCRFEGKRCVSANGPVITPPPGFFLRLVKVLVS